ncbi:MAG TPA: hypothetical protein VF655_01075 [Allosphingosinicella sp.]|jgi:hypothetical protein
MTGTVNSLELDFELCGAGWVNLHLRVGDLHHEIGRCSYLTDVLDDLIRIGLNIATDGGHGFAVFDHEPGSTVLFAEAGWWEGEQPVWTDGYRISVIDWQGEGEPSWSNLRNQPRLFIAEVSSRDAVADAILKCAERVLARHGIDGYSKLWTGRLGFPSRGLAALRAALSTEARPREGWNG